MTTLEERLAAIRAAAEGPQVAAFFDYDGTVISGFSARAFYEHRFRHLDWNNKTHRQHRTVVRWGRRL